MGNVLAVFKFEWRRALSVPRIAWWLVLVAFPILICSLIRQADGNLPREPWSVAIFALIPMLTSYGEVGFYEPARLNMLMVECGMSSRLRKSFR